MKKLLVIASAFALVSCAASIPKKAYPPTDPSSITIVNDLPTDAELLQRVTSTSCSPNPIGGPPKGGLLLADLKKQAAKIGATGIYKVQYSLTGLLQKCVILPGMRATGIAFRKPVDRGPVESAQ